ncbi:MAG TPA: ABC transporter substrate-binding protein [Gemmatimonadales bacterium]|nr:ABC transporter substrate-binding protein [Gemmatimonadales bacterium]
MAPVVRRSTLAGALAASLVAVAAFAATRGAFKGRDRNTIVIVTAQQATVPIPTMIEGAASATGNQDLADQLFLRLAALGPGLNTSGDAGFTPQLARSWTRRDSVTLAFDLDPRARWHDGAPVVAQDVLLAFERARNPKIAPKLADLLHHIVSVTAESDRRVVIRFDHPYAEQFYDATFQVQPLPSHLLPNGAATPDLPRAFVDHPVGNGPFRFVRTVPGQFTELAADPKFFLGKPGMQRLFLRIAADPDARMNLLLTGEVDAMDAVPAPLSNIERLSGAPDLKLVSVPSPLMGYLLFNQRDRADSARPHPILSDSVVRQALVLALDRQLMLRATFGRWADVPYGPVSQLLWVRRGSPRAAGPDTARARKLLASRGWTDHDGDGVLDRAGRPLSLALNYPLQSDVRRQLGLLVQEQLRQLGVHIDLVRLDGPVWAERRSRGDFDIDFSSASQDPTPSGLTQSWSCHGGTNVAHYCDPGVDSLMERAMMAQRGAGALWQQALRRIEADAPAAFIYAPSYVFAVNRRLGTVKFEPVSVWRDLWEWSVR